MFFLSAKECEGDYFKRHAIVYDSLLLVMMQLELFTSAVLQKSFSNLRTLSIAEICSCESKELTKWLFFSVQEKQNLLLALTALQRRTTVLHTLLRPICHIEYQSVVQTAWKSTCAKLLLLTISKGHDFEQSQFHSDSTWYLSLVYVEATNQ